MRSWWVFLLTAAFSIVSSIAVSAENTETTSDSSLLVFDPEAVDEEGYSCRIESDNWTSHHRASTKDPLKVLTWFKGGSGRYWTIAIDNGSNEWICLSTSTLGWRSLQKFEDGPLPWVRDFDGDGLNEFVYWESFALGESIASGYGLTARVYRMRGKNKLVTDSLATRMIRQQLITAYQQPMDQMSESSRQQRKKAAELIQESLLEINDSFLDEN